MQQLRPLRNAKQASEYLAEKGIRVAPGSLNKWRVTGGGPKFRKFGRQRLYDEPDLDEWSEEKLSAPMRSTSDSETAV